MDWVLKHECDLDKQRGRRRPLQSWQWFGYKNMVAEMDMFGAGGVLPGEREVGRKWG